MLSAVYRQGSGDNLAANGSSKGLMRSSQTQIVKVKLEVPQAGSRAIQIDPENKLLWRMNRQRLDFESLRDTLLFVSGALDPTPGGKAEEIFKPPFSKRRSVYGFIDRQFLPGALRVFDFANPDMHNPQRSETTVPQQALFFMNSPFVLEQARSLAARVGTNEGVASQNRELAEEKIRKLYRLAYQRDPTPVQLSKALRFIDSAGSDLQHEEKKAPSGWKYGYGEFDESSQKLKTFEPLPHFTGEAWQGGKNWPDEKLGWAQLTAAGGHAGNDMQHAVIRRWVAANDATVAIEATVKHERKEGDGIRAYIVSSRKGLLGKWVVHSQSAETSIPALEVKSGDTIDFIVSIHQSLNSNDFMWSPVIRMTGPDAIRDANGYAKQWNAAKEFDGPPGEERKPLTAWEQYAQVLLLSNEFLFVD